MVLTATFWILYGLYAALIVGVVVVILSQNRNPLKSLAWITVLLLLPMVGLVLYFFFGQSIKNTRMMSRRKKRRLLGSEKAPSLSSDVLAQIPAEQRPNMRLADALDHARLYPAGDIKIYSDGREFFHDVMRDIEAARRCVNVQFYIIDDDGLGRRFADLLMRKAAQGVKVRFIYDYVGCYGTKKRFFRRLNRAGVEAHPFFRVVFPRFGSRINWRNHRKAVVIDGHTAYVGSMNVADRYVDGGGFGTWRDTAVRLTGAPVAGVQRNFAIDWSFMGQPLIVPDDDCAPPGGDSQEPAPTQRPTQGVQLVTSGPTGRWSNIAFTYFRAITGARRRVYIQTPYFLPTEALLKALQVTALSGVDVRVMMPRRSDSRILTYASQSYVAECLQAGVKFYLYDGMLHSKVLIIDHDTVTLGSANFDFRSFEHNFEGNLLIYDRGVCRRFAEQYFDDIGRCRKLTLHTWTRRPRALRTGESLARLVSPIL